MDQTARGTDDFSRRDFHRLATAALGGLLAGTLGGCLGDKAEPARPESSGAHADSKSGSSSPVTPPVVTTAVALHACRGLNECKGLGKGHKNACVGQGDCYTVKHECAGQNDCKFQGGCGGTNGFNDCKGKGGCGHFPIQGQAIWKKARAQFEARMKVAGKKVGAAPAPAATG